MANYYIVATKEQNKKCYAYRITVSESDNLKLLLPDDVRHAEIVSTMEKANAKVRFWNKVYKELGKYLYD